MVRYGIIDRAARDWLGEGPLWVARLNCLFWVDILAPKLWSFSLATGAIESWPMPEPIGWIVERADREDFLIGLASGVARLALDPFVIEPIVDPEPDRPDNRLNDAKVDHRGRLWLGTKSDGSPESKGALYRLDPDLSVSRHDDGYGVTNGPAFSPDGAHFYHSDSAIRTVYRFTLEADGALADKQAFIRFEEDWGFPDGMTVDRDGGLWIAHWAGGRVSRFTADGALDRSIALPAANITSCCFAGVALDRLFVTSAAMDDGAGTAAGCLFEVETGQTGLAARAFAG
ncbi:SMP-30/gluconolactonase/LRE family protein [Sphingomonas koreensis]|nr:SMP-30/gluconolactonase/LRE family protein [Sphingomonas koreensis]